MREGSRCLSLKAELFEDGSNVRTPQATARPTGGPPQLSATPGQRIEMAGRLRHEPQAATTETRKTLVGEVRAIEAQPPPYHGIRWQDAEQGVGQKALACPRRAHQRQHLAAPDAKTQALEGRHLDLPDQPIIAAEAD